MQARGRVLAPVAAVAWVGFALLGGVVKLALFRSQRTPGAVAVLWGIGFGIFLWAGSLSVGLDLARAIIFGLVAGASIALFVYFRGAGLENPPAAQPGAFYRRPRSPARSTDRSTQGRDLHRARVALTDDDVDGALFYLREVERVAVAQRKLDELLEVRDFLSNLPRTPAVEGLERRVGEDLHGFPAGELAAAGIHVQSELELVESLRARVGGLPRTADLEPARGALEAGDFANALFLLEDGRRVGVAQRRLPELLEVYELVHSLCERSSGRTRVAAEALERKVVAGLRSFAPYS